MTKTALLFPGQGAQSVGMAQPLIARSQLARDMFAEASEILGYDLAKLCESGPEEKLNETDHSQPALFVHSMAALKVWREEEPDLDESICAVAGLSLGEYSALCAAGGISFADGVRLVQKRGQAMQSAANSVDSGMSSVIGLETSDVEKLCNQNRRDDEVLQVANLLCPGNIAISGHSGSLADAEAAAADAGARAFINLSVAGAFHTSLMEPARQALATALESVQISDTTLPLFSNVDAAKHTAAGDFRELFPRQLVSTVRWGESLQAMLDSGVEQFYEIGTGKVLAGTVKRVHRKTKCFNYGDS